MVRFLRLVDVKDNSRVEGSANLFPEHFDDPQKAWFLGVRVGARSMPVWL